jgi:preprotein translocase subunit SecA
MNKQRESVYTLRQEILDGHIHLTEEEVVDTRAYVMALAEELLEAYVDRFIGKDVELEEHNVPGLVLEAGRLLGLDQDEVERLDLGTKGPDEATDAIWAFASEKYKAKEELVGAEMMRRTERDVLLQVTDSQWKDHLYSLDHLKEGIGLRGYGQRDPLVEYKKESYALFQDMKARVEEEAVRILFWLRPVRVGETEAPRPVVQPRKATPITMNNPSAEAVPAFASVRAAAPAPVAAGAAPAAPTPARTGGDDVVKTVRRDEPKVGRNDVCPCGSGKKYKKCHGSAA